MISTIDPSLTIEKIQNSPEGHHFDRKSARLSERDFARHISAFSNAAGGVLAIGVEDDGCITGVDDKRDSDFRKALIDHFRTTPQCVIEEVYVNSLRIVLFHIKPCVDYIVKCSNGEAYLRVGDSSRKLSAEEVLALEFSKGIRSYEGTVISEATIDDLDEELIDEYARVVGAAPQSSPLGLLRARGIIKGPENKPEITVAGIVLFGKIPTQFLPSARVRFLRYEGTSIMPGASFNVVKDVTIEKPLHKLLTEEKQLLANQMREFQQLTKSGVFKKIPEYPEFAWLEGLVNAVTHRDYSVQGEYVRISMFDDRIEFLSPGKLPNIVTIQNIQNTRFSRNPLIARVLSDFGWVRELNEGVKRIYTDMESFFLEPPVFSEPNGNTVKLQLKNNIAMRSLRKMEGLKAITLEEWTNLKPLDQDIVYYIANFGKCTTRMLEQATGKSRQTLVQHLKTLLTENGGPIEEHSSSPTDPTKYYTIR